MVSLGTVVTVMTIANLLITIVLALLLYRFSVRQAQTGFEQDVKSSIQQLNLAAIASEPILPYLQKYDIENYELSEQEAIDIYYLYFELNLIRSFVAAKKFGIANKTFYDEAVDERIWRIVPYRLILEKMKTRGKNYSGSFLQFVIRRMDQLLESKLDGK